MANREKPQIEKNRLVEQYESLRQQIIFGFSEVMNTPYGLTIFLKDGMASWINIWLSCYQALLTKSEEKSAIITSGLTTEYKSQLVILLANMVLNCNKEML